MQPSVEMQRRLVMGLVRLPAFALRALVGGPKKSPEGFVLDPQVQAIIAMAERLAPVDYPTLGPERARRMADRVWPTITERPTGPLTTRDVQIPVDGGSVRARVYTPIAAGGSVSASAMVALPILVYFHGGGFVMGSVVSHDGIARSFALGAECVVVSVEYRLAPEHEFPVAAMDALAAFRWTVAHAGELGGDATRVAVGGDSAGGNLAAVVSRETRRETAKPVFQLLIYPAIDFTRRGASHGFFQKGFMLDKPNIDWFTDLYVPNHGDYTHRLASPALQSDHAGGPPAMVVTAGFDPLRDEGDGYADALRAAGVRVQHARHEGLVHGFVNMNGAVRAAKRAVDEMVSVLRRELVIARG